MKTRLHDILADARQSEHATDRGSEMHLRLQRVSLDLPRDCDADLIARINSCDGLARFFRTPARPEVPIAGTVNGRFLSRRVDRMIIDPATKTVQILDYKTDIDRNARRDKYIAQIGEYAALMRQICPGYKIETFILWLHDWVLERV